MKWKKGKKIKMFNLRILIRRANAYAKQGQIYSAKSDINTALSIDPNDQKILKILDQYKNME